MPLRLRLRQDFSLRPVTSFNVMTKLSTIPQHQLSITCGLCSNHKMLAAAKLIALAMRPLAQ